MYTAQTSPRGNFRSSCLRPVESWSHSNPFPLLPYSEWTVGKRVPGSEDKAADERKVPGFPFLGSVELCLLPRQKAVLTRTKTIMGVHYSAGEFDASV